MPIVYLSPSTHEFIQLSGGGSEEDYMNLIGVLDEELRGKYKLIDDLKKIIKKYRSED